MKIPATITADLEDDGFKVDYLGKREGLDVYYAYIPDAKTGFPIVYLCENDVIRERLDGFDALDMWNKMNK